MKPQRIPPVYDERWLTQFVQELLNELPLRGTVHPEGNIVAPVGRLYIRTEGGAGTTLYVKESGTGADGWAAK